MPAMRKLVLQRSLTLIQLVRPQSMTMQEKQHARLGFVQTRLPWVVAAAVFIVYAVTVNRWVSLGSLPFAAKVAGWDWTLPLNNPLFYVLTFPIRWFPGAWQPVALNLFAAACAALTLALLARSVSLLPHDRTHAQRQRERSEFSLLTLPSAWLPPVFAVLVCAFQLTFWENATAATNEALDLLIFAYLIRCLLEYRIDLRDSWISRFALVYGLGVTNNWALIGFAPLFLVALIWIRGLSFFDSGFLLRLTGFGIAGLLLYLLLPLFWALSPESNLSFWQALKTQLAAQRSYLLDTPALRNRVLVLSLTSLLPILIMGIRWPSSFGDTSAAGAALTNIMFRVIHFVFLVACLWIFFDQRFSPRALGYGLPFLTFYYLSALAVGYFSGYLLLVSSEAKGKTWRRRSSVGQFFDYAVKGAVWIAAIGVPAALVYKNLDVVWKNNGPVLRDLAEVTARNLPTEPAYVIGDEPYTLLLLQGYLASQKPSPDHVLIHTRSLAIPNYHQTLMRRYPNRIPNVTQGIPPGEIVDDGTLIQMMANIGASNRIFYLHPSFGFYFERFYARPSGLVHELLPYPADSILTTPSIEPAQVQKNQTFWTESKPVLDQVNELAASDSRDAKEVSIYYSRALNSWGVELQKARQLDAANEQFELAIRLNTNNIPALVNREYNRTLRTGDSRTNQIAKILEERLGAGNWNAVLVQNGPFDHPDFCYRLGQVFAQQTLFRQSAAQFERAFVLDTNYLAAPLSLADVYIKAGYPQQALAKLTELRSRTDAGTDQSVQVELVRLEAAAHFAQANYAEAERILLEAEKRHTNQISVLDGLVMLYAKTQRYTNALTTIDRILRIAPDNVQAMVNQATLHFNNTNYAKAFAALDQVLSKDSRNLQALLYKVFMQIETKDYANAQKVLTQILDRDPDHQEALMYQAVLAIETEKYTDAIETLTRLIKLQPRTPVLLNALRNRAIAHLKKGNFDEAKLDYERIQQHSPRYFPAYYGLGEIAYQRKQRDDAIRYYELYLKFAPASEASLAEERKTIQARLDELKAVANP